MVSIHPGHYPNYKGITSNPFKIVSDALQSKNPAHPSKRTGFSCSSVLTVTSKKPKQTRVQPEEGKLSVF